MYKVKAIMNYNGTYRLEDRMRELVGWRCELAACALKDMCAQIVLWKEDDENEPPELIITSPIREIMGTENKTDLTIKTQNTIYELELVQEG